MKKIALLLAVLMLVSCCFVMVGCGDDDDSSSEDSPKKAAQDAVKYQLMAEVTLSTLGGSDISFISCTYGSTKDLGDNNFKISGTVKVKDEYGNFHVANYTATVEYDAGSDDYDADVSIGTFKKQ